MQPASSGSKNQHEKSKLKHKESIARLRLMPSSEPAHNNIHLYGNNSLARSFFRPQIVIKMKQNST